MVRLSVNNIMTKVEGASEHLQLVWDILSYRVKGAEHRDKYLERMYGKRRATAIAKQSSETKSFFNRRGNAFLTGLLKKVALGLKENGVGFQIVDMRVKPPNPQRCGDFSLKGITMYDYQQRVIDDFLENGRGVARLATGAGKTEIAIALTKGLALPTLFLTHRVNLLNQTARRYAKRCPELKSKIGILGGGISEPKQITIATVQTLFALIKKHPKQMAEFLTGFKFLIIDEAHRSGAKQFYIPAALCKNAYYRLALTATPFMNGDDEADMYLMGTTADIVTKVTNGELIERGILAKPLFKFFQVNTPDLSSCRNWRDIYEQGIIYNSYRNTMIAKQTRKLVDLNKKVLVICRETAHGELLRELLADDGIRVDYCDGKNSKVAERERALKRIKDDKLDVIVCTNIFDEGIDVNDINAIVLAGGTKSAPALFQRTGRAIRRKDDENENYAIIIDFIDQTHRILYEHSIARYNLVKNEKGFTIL